MAAVAARRRRIGSSAAGGLVVAQVRRGRVKRCPRCLGRLGRTSAPSLMVVTTTVIVCGYCVTAERYDAELRPVWAWPVPRRRWLRPQSPSVDSRKRAEVLGANDGAPRSAERWAAELARPARADGRTRR